MQDTLGRNIFLFENIRWVWTRSHLPWCMVNTHVCSQVNKSRWNWDIDTTTMAYGMKSSLQSYGVIVGFIVLKNSFDYLKGLSPKLQRQILTYLRHTQWLTTSNQIFNVCGMAVVYNSRDGTRKESSWLLVWVLKWKCQGFQRFNIIGRMYLLTHFFFITRDQLALLLLVSYSNSCRTISLQTTAGMWVLCWI